MRIAAGILLTFSLLCTPALAQKLSVDFEKTFDFSTARTVAWGRGTPAPNEFNQKRIENAIEAQLTAAGLELLAPDASVDLYVISHAGGHQHQKQSNVNVGIGLSRRTSHGSIGVGTSTGGRTKTVVTGTLVIQFIDAKNEKMVWRADLSDTLSGNAEKDEAKINRAVEKAFKKYPPKPKK